jgi:hypothetical protein
MKLDKRLFVALLVVAVLALIPAACGDSISGGRSLSVYGQGAVQGVVTSNQALFTPSPGAISAAVSAANDGDTIRLLAAKYLDNVDVDKSLNIIGAGPTRTFVDPDPASPPVFTIDASKIVTLSGMTIENGQATSGELQLRQ